MQFCINLYPKHKKMPLYRTVYSISILALRNICYFLKKHLKTINNV